MREARPRSSGWARGPCPMCGRPNTFSVQVATGHFHCFSAGCEMRGSLDPSAEWADRAAEAPAPDTTEATTPPEGFVPLGHGDGATAWCTKKARAYLSKRGVTLQ